jgi:DNA-binding transcriptional regulator YiaG
MYHDISCGLPNVWLANGYNVTQDPKWGECVSFDDPDGLTQAITLHLCLSPYYLTGEGVRFLRRRLGLTQGELGRELGCSGQAVAKWEKGKSRIPGASARLLRLLVAARVIPEEPLAQATVPYSKAPPARLEFAYDEDIWHYAAHRYAPSECAPALRSAKLAA